MLALSHKKMDKNSLVTAALRCDDDASISAISIALMFEIR